jgi:hypothetical protein
MTDDIRKREILSDEPDAELTTADLAGANQRLKPGNVEEEIIETESRSVGFPGRQVEVPVSTNAVRTGTAAVAAAPALERETGPLFSSDEAKDLRARWDAIQVGFVDEPRRAVEQADNLVAGAMKRLAEIFAQERSNLEAQWDQGENVSTEDLRLALRRYRSFFSRLLSV